MTEISPRMLEILLIGALITLPLKALSLWRSARNYQKAWYIALLLINTLGLLELTYLFYFSNPKTKD